eukprot:CAMPEP_0198138534 /NCGR_PEP_ID=MMETSP1443-20131203/1919_1 /TAXON_ID=186043 /ORGANISM="Entomoneis sp., Strain CCMP2396" /LENGTH=408 /DNA_ID=CAMNT_0043800339 /DNA_START=150 /DNA_END=1376 /DNA_ORIENTATION=+
MTKETCLCICSLHSLQDGGGCRDVDLKLALAAVRHLADCVPRVLFAAAMDPNELEIAFSDAIQHASQNKREEDAELILLEAVKMRHKSVQQDSRGTSVNVQPTEIISSANGRQGPRDRVEDLPSSVVGLEHVKSQVRCLRRTVEISDLRESLMSWNCHNSQRGYTSLLPAGLAEDAGRPVCSYGVFAGNPGTGKTAVARLLAKVFHELGLLRKPKFLEVERMDLVARDKEMTIIKTREVLDEARAGVLFIDEASTLGMASKRNRIDTGNDAIMELVRNIDAARTAKDDTFSLIILTGFPLEVNVFLSFQPELRRRFPTTFEFPDYTCTQVATIFLDLATVKGFEFDTSISEDVVSALLQQETTSIWRSERKGRVSERFCQRIIHIKANHIDSSQTKFSFRKNVVWSDE